MMLNVSIAVFGAGAALLALSGISFKLRALMNKPAWGGKTLPLLTIGLPLAAAGGVMLAIFYKQ